jgi:methionyl-tRNA synthetase
MSRVLSAVAWPYASGPRHIGHVAGFGVPSDVFSRYMRMAGHDVLMVSGTDEHGTPILVAADHEGRSPRETADHYNRLIVEDLHSLGLAYDLFTRTTTPNHYDVVQRMFTAVWDNGYFVTKTTLGAISPSTGRTLPDRYVEGICPICGYDGARGDQCDNCGNQLDPIDLKEPRSRINGETPIFVESEHVFLDLPALADEVSAWLDTRTQWRPNVLTFSRNLLAEIQPRAITRDIDWGIPIPIEGWRENPTKRLYVWFDAVIGYLSASVEWARRSGDPDAWEKWWHDPDASSYYFMGKDNIVFHSLIWPSELLAQNGQGSRGGKPGSFGVLNLPTEVVSSEFLTMEGKKFSSSRRVGIYVRDMLSRYSPDSLRYFLIAAGPENADTDFTFSEFVRRNNDELVNTWGNLVNRTVSMIAANLGEIPPTGDLTEADSVLLASTAGGFEVVGDLIGRHRQKQAIGEAMRLAIEANGYLSQQAPWKLRTSDPARMATVLHVACQAVDDINRILAPFLPFAAETVHQLIGRSGRLHGEPRIEIVDDLDGGPSYPVITGDYRDPAPWRSVPIVPGTPLAAPTPVFAKLDQSVVDEELARLEAQAG